MNLFETLTNAELVECFEQMLYWGGNNNPPENSLLEKIQLEYFRQGVPNIYVIMQLDLFKVMAQKWYDDVKIY